MTKKKTTKKKKGKNKGKMEKDVLMMYVFAGIIVIIAIILLGWYATRGNTTNNVTAEFIIEQEEIEKDDCDFRKVIDGVCVEKEADQYQDLVGVMIENHSQARPQAGLAEARVVYEAPVEANFTRFLALFDNTGSIEKVGPVRSARPYFLDWIEEYGKTPYLHVGGSPDALDKINAYGIFDVNEFFQGNYFYRGRDRVAPHNVYTSSKLWNGAIAKIGGVLTHAPNDSSWKYEEQESCEKECINDITATFLSHSFVTGWEYEEKTKVYKRYQNRNPHQDQRGKIITANTVIVQHVKTNVIDTVGRLQMQTIGEGVVDVFQKGHHTKGIWKKKSRKDKTRWFTTEGDEIALTAGTIWIEVLPQDGTLEVE
jgi:hypothetical protein